MNEVNFSFSHEYLKNDFREDNSFQFSIRKKNVPDFSDLGKIVFPLFLEFALSVELLALLANRISPLQK